jgi:chromate transporter
MPGTREHERPSLLTIFLEWGRIGCIGFGGPPAHMSLLRNLCVRDRRWLTREQFEHALAATNMLPGPASTQLAIYCAWRLRGTRGALIGGLCFICPGLAAMIALSALFLTGSPPDWLRGAAMGAGAAVAAVAVRAGTDLAAPIWHGAAGPRRTRVAMYALAGAIAAATLGAWLVLVLLGAGAIELAAERGGSRPGLASLAPGGWSLHALAGERGLMPALAATLADPGGTGALAWTALKVGALAFGGGFVIVPLMQADAVNTYHWMTHAQFLNAVALGQLTPGPVTQTVAAVGYAAGGLGDALLASAIAFAPSFSFILLGGERFERLLTNGRVRAFLAGAAPAAAGAIVGSAIPLASAISESWQYVLLAAAALSLLAARRGVLATLVGCTCAGALASLLGAPIVR